MRLPDPLHLTTTQPGDISARRNGELDTQRNTSWYNAIPPWVRGRAQDSPERLRRPGSPVLSRRRKATSCRGSGWETREDATRDTPMVLTSLSYSDVCMFSSRQVPMCSPLASATSTRGVGHPQRRESREGRLSPLTRWLRTIRDGPIAVDTRFGRPTTGDGAPPGEPSMTDPWSRPWLGRHCRRIVVALPHAGGSRLGHHSHACASRPRDTGRSTGQEKSCRLRVSSRVR